MKIDVFNYGMEECEHVWVYRTLNMMNFSLPPTYIQQRICPYCGRLEVISDNTEYKNESELFKEVFDKYYHK